MSCDPVGWWLTSARHSPRCYYGVMLASKANTPGYDLETADDRPVQVRTLVFGSGAHSAYAGRTRRPSRAS
jgi:hypothetical protein